MWSLLMRDFNILPFSTNCKVNVKRTNICEAISFLLKSLVLKWSPKSIKFYLFTRSSDVFIHLFFSSSWDFLHRMMFPFSNLYFCLHHGRPLLVNACQACICICICICVFYIWYTGMSYSISLNPMLFIKYSTCWVCSLSL